MFNQNYVIAILQGASGSAKSTISGGIATIAKARDLSYIICSADDYFIEPITKEYKFDRTKLGEAHKSCQSSFNNAVKCKINWIIIDNTNVDLKSIKSYYNPDNGYRYKIVRPNSKWYFNAEECFKKNTHNVPLETIQRMIDSIKKFSLEEMRADIVWI